MKHICKPLQNNKTLDPTDFHCIDKSYLVNIFFNNTILHPIDFHCTTKTKTEFFFKTYILLFPIEGTQTASNDTNDAPQRSASEV